MIFLAKKLGMSVCAEGVENAEVLTALGALDCDAAQGYLISPPVPAARFLDVVAKWNQRGVARLVPARDSQRENVIRLRSGNTQD